MASHLMDLLRLDDLLPGGVLVEEHGDMVVVGAVEALLRHLRRHLHLCHLPVLELHLLPQSLQHLRRLLSLLRLLLGRRRLSSGLCLNQRLRLRHLRARVRRL